MSETKKVHFSDKLQKWLDLESIFAHNAAYKIGLIATLSTLLEIIGLMQIAIYERNMTWISALSRYGLAGFFELLFTFIFIVSSIKIVDNLISKFTLKSILSFIWQFIKGIIGITAFMLLSLVPTFFINIFYFESLGAILVEFNIDNFPFYFNIVMFPEREIVDELGNITYSRTYGEISAILMIWFNPLLNICQLGFYTFNAVNKVKIIPETIKPTVTEPGKPHIKIIDLNEAVKKACEIVTTNLTEATALYNEAKNNLAKMFDPADSMYDLSLKRGTKTVKEVEQALIDTLNGSDMTLKGIEGYMKLTNNGSLTLKLIQEDIDKAAKEIVRLTEAKKLIPANDTNALTKAAKELSDLHVPKNVLTKKKTDLEDLIKDLKSAMTHSGLLN